MNIRLHSLVLVVPVFVAVGAGIGGIRLQALQSEELWSARGVSAALATTVAAFTPPDVALAPAASTNLPAAPDSPQFQRGWDTILERGFARGIAVLTPDLTTIRRKAGIADALLGWNETPTEILAALDSAPNFVTRLYPSGSATFMASFAPLRGPGGRTVGICVVVCDRSDTAAALQSHRREFALFVAVFSLLGALSAMGPARRFARAVTQIRDATDRMAATGEPIALSVTGLADVDDLAGALATMADTGARELVRNQKALLSVERRIGRENLLAQWRAHSQVPRLARNDAGEACIACVGRDAERLLAGLADGPDGPVLYAGCLRAADLPLLDALRRNAELAEAWTRLLRTASPAVLLAQAAMHPDIERVATWQLRTDGLLEQCIIPGSPPSERHHAWSTDWSVAGLLNTADQRALAGLAAHPGSAGATDLAELAAGLLAGTDCGVALFFRQTPCAATPHSGVHP